MPGLGIKPVGWDDVMLRVGLIGCGNLSETYLGNAPLFRDFTITAASDRRLDLAHAYATKYGISACSTQEMIERDDIDAILNLTVPAAHSEISRERGLWETIDVGSQPFGQPNFPESDPTVANYRGLGRAEMAQAIALDRPHCASGDLGLHVLEALLCIEDAAHNERTVPVTSRV